MNTETQFDQAHDLGQKLNEAVLKQAFAPASEGEGEAAEKPAEKREKGGVSPVNGVRTPAGRPKGVRNRLTNLRDAVLEAFDEVGGTAYLARLANGTQSDRAAFVGLVAKVLPTQINANVEGGIQVQLSWLGGRNIGTTVAQSAEPITQVVDLERDSAGKYRIKDQVTEGESPSPAENPDPLPPQNGQVGG